RFTVTPRAGENGKNRKTGKPDALARRRARQKTKTIGAHVDDLLTKTWSDSNTGLYLDAKVFRFAGRC
ncbi:hypothetical protein, partial [Pseudomonas sp. 21_B]|uniref:hypothetical protein n=1 Tax=Pseudomonas sp. 21_B TaxID=2813561 RepID=UPI001A9EF3BA